ncbi:hypothetical protein GSI_06041 [Ganoderma sinense ZZ0214-1]|uniref:Uncharacterized protein n=1 Tax=Ganoderma sinense ZZ0214-1 TaxID=1077348 RepID=A0A2G8SC74_9APHY|nr:hypothetical protein GSI_06041 [Ganoderma sinense ZZ0214-1]
MATPVRNHIFQRCEGYVKYRAPIPGVMENPPLERDQPTPVKDEEVDCTPTIDEKSEDAAEETLGRKGDAANTNLTTSSVQPTPDIANDGDRTTTVIPKSLPPPSPSPTTPSNISSSPSEPGATVTSSLFALLRPAQWSPVNITSGVGMNAALLDSRPSAPSLAPSLAGGLSSSSSVFSVRTWPDDQPPGVAVSSPKLKLKVEGDSHMIDSASVSGFASGSRSMFQAGLPFGPRLRHDMDLDDRPPSAARAFLDGLRRPLGHAARHLHALGVVSEADLDLICTMPDAWDELGELLTRSGVTVIEWLMVKEAFKVRARLVSAVV